MLNSARAQDVKPRPAARRLARSWRVTAAMLVLLGSLAAAALAAGAGLTLGSASNAALGRQVLISAQGRTLYSLSPETSRHVLCKSKECLKNWPPLTIASGAVRLKDGAGVSGHLAMLKRANGIFQVTLRGAPLYRYSQDHAKGEANGEGIESFGGIWHAVSASGSAPASPPAAPSMPTTPSTPAPPSMPPSYPSY
jgi:predicted lipoprotein with Yx(FWY)xxD motif